MCQLREAEGSCLKVLSRSEAYGWRSWFGLENLMLFE